MTDTELEDDMAGIGSGAKPRTVIILIHGTFATGAPWTRPHSWFRQSLTRSLAQRSVVGPELSFVDWSGGNSHTARVEGSRSLAAHLSELDLTIHDNCHIIAHSHGGNVALHAIVHHEIVRERVDGVVTLATPFLLFRDETPLVARVAAGLDASAAKAFEWASIPLVSAIVLVPLTFVLHDLFDWKFAWINGSRRGLIDACALMFPADPCRYAINGTTGLIDGGIAIVITLGILLNGFLDVESQQVDERKDAATRLAELTYLQPPERLSQTRILAMSAPIDEALQVLNTSWWAHRVTLWVTRAAVVLSLAVGTAATVLALAELGLTQQSTVGTDAFTLQSSTATFIAKVTLIPLAFAAGALVGAVLRLVASLPALGFGSSSGRDNLFWTVTARRHPDGAPLAQLRTYGLRSLLARGGPLIHSRLYDSRRAVQDIADFIAEDSAR